MAGGVVIGGAPVLTLRDRPQEGRPGFVEATILPGRGFMLLQARIGLASGERVDALVAPDPALAALELDGGPEDFAGNKAFSFGGAILVPYANRIRGRALDATREIETPIDGQVVRLPRNWGGKAAGAEAYAMHGLILATPVVFEQPSDQVVRGRLAAGSFNGRWPGRAELAFEWRLEHGDLSLRVEATSRGAEQLPFAAGWHPYFRLASGDRRQARLRVPANRRVEVNNYDEVLPTGRVLEVQGTPYDFRSVGGRALGDLGLDDCFTDIVTDSGEASVELIDPAARLGLRIAFPAPPVRAIQVYAPPDEPFVVIEPQFNLADPFGPQWPPNVDTGMVRLPNGASSTYQVRLSAMDLVEV